MPDKLIIVLANTDPDNGAEAAPPFFQAGIAAAMDYEVEVIFTGRSGKLAQSGVAEGLRVNPDDEKTLYDFIREAHENGATFKVCAPTIELWGKDLIPEITQTVGSAYLISEAMNDDTVTFTY